MCSVLIVQLRTVSVAHFQMLVVIHFLKMHSKLLETARRAYGVTDRPAHRFSSS